MTKQISRSAARTSEIGLTLIIGRQLLPLALVGLGFWLLGRWSL